MGVTFRVRAKKLRKINSDAERWLWSALRDRRLLRYKFRRQYIIEPYIVDFVCLSKKLIIELDGSQHAERQEYDAKRTIFLESKGFKVMRFWNNVVLSEKENVLSAIIHEL